MYEDPCPLWAYCVADSPEPGPVGHGALSYLIHQKVLGQLSILFDAVVHVFWGELLPTPHNIDLSNFRSFENLLLVLQNLLEESEADTIDSRKP